MVTYHQQGNVSVIDLTEDSLNESISSYNQDKQKVPYIRNKTDSNNSIGTHSSKFSSGRDNSTITSGQPIEIVPIVQENIGNCNIMENIYWRLVGETLSQATIPYFQKIKYSIHLMSLMNSLIHSLLNGDFV